MLTEVDQSARDRHPGGHLTRVNGRVRLSDGSDAVLSVASVLRLEAADGAASEPAGAHPDANQSVLAFGVALANALAEAGSPPARLRIDATLWVSSARGGSDIARAELHISGEGPGVTQSTLEECARRIARGENTPVPFGTSQVSVTAVVPETPAQRTGRRVDLSHGSAEGVADGPGGPAASESPSAISADDVQPPLTARQGLRSLSRPAVAPSTPHPEKQPRLFARRIVWFAAAVVLLLLALAYFLIRSQ